MGMNVGGGGKSRVTPAMNVTPLVDVVLVLLIIFMVVTPLLTKKMWLHVPKKDKVENEVPAAPPSTDTVKPIVLTYHRDGTIKINAQVVPREELSHKITRVLAPRADPLVFFDAQNDAAYGEAVEVMDLAREGGAIIAVLTEAVTQ